MSLNPTMRGVRPRLLTLSAPMPLIRPDRARSIDRIIDYFGGEGWRIASFHRPPVAWREGQRTTPGADRGRFASGVEV